MRFGNTFCGNHKGASDIMIHWRTRLVFLAVVALTLVSAVGGAIHWGALRAVVPVNLGS